MKAYGLPRRYCKVIHRGRRGQIRPMYRNATTRIWEKRFWKKKERREAREQIKEELR